MSIFKVYVTGFSDHHSYSAWSQLPCPRTKLYVTRPHLYQIRSFDPWVKDKLKVILLSTILPLQLPLRWRHDERDGVSNHQPHDCLLKCLFRRRSKERSKLHATGLCVGNSPVTDEFPTQRASNAEDVSIWWRHHDEILGSSVELIRSSQNFAMLSAKF